MELNSLIVCSVLDFENNAKFYLQSFSESIIRLTLHLIKEGMPRQQLEPEELQEQTADKSNS